MQVGGALPDWGFKQQEINGQKGLPEKATTWFVEEILMDECTLSPDRPSAMI